MVHGTEEVANNNCTNDDSNGNQYDHSCQWLWENDGTNYDITHPQHVCLPQVLLSRQLLNCLAASHPPAMTKPVSQVTITPMMFVTFLISA